MIYALIENNKVKNTIKADQAFVDKLQGEWLRIDELTPRPGRDWDYLNGEFIAPPVPEPPPETPEQVVEREARERLSTVKQSGNVPIQGVELQNLLKDIIEVLF